MLNNAPNVVELREYCPGSAALSEGLPRLPETPEMLKGIALHAAIDDVLARGMSWQAATYAHGIVEEYDKRTVATAERLFVNGVKRLEQQLDAESGQVLAEVAVNLLPSGWDGSARLDFLVTFVNFAGVVMAVLVIELKTGTHVVTGPEANRQLHDYLVGAAGLYPGCQRFIGAILQPAVVDELAWRVGKWTRAEVLDGFGPAEGPNEPGLLRQLQKIRERTQPPDAPLVWGDHCGTCRCREMCPARRGTLADTIKLQAETGSTVAEYMAKLTPVERLAEWKRVKQAASYAKKFDELVKAWIMDNPTDNTVPGYKVGTKPGNREFDSHVPAPQLAAKAWEVAGEDLAAAGFKGPDDLVECIGPKTVEDRLSKAAFAKLQAAGLIVRPEGGLSVIEDKAPAMPRPRKD